MKDADDESMTREPEMVKAYRDTWELGLHSYLTYLRDRLLVARELLTPSGSVFVQISDENVHHVRELMDDVFGTENFVSLITFVKQAPKEASKTLPTIPDYLVWYARNRSAVKYNRLFRQKSEGRGSALYSWIEEPDGTRRKLTREEANGDRDVLTGSRAFMLSDVCSQGETASPQEFSFGERRFHPRPGTHWTTTVAGLERLAEQGRIMLRAGYPAFVRFFDDYPVLPLANVWDDTGTGSFTDQKIYVVQTGRKAVQRCILMTTDPGDLVVDPTCGSGTTAYVAEQWGRRWITVDTSRVPLALTRQRLLTATFPYYELRDPERGPGGGFVYKRKQNAKGEEVGGIVPHVTLRSIANDEPPQEEVLVDRPEVNTKVTRVTGPYCAEATIPTPLYGEGDSAESIDASTSDSLAERMLEVLRRDPVLHLPGDVVVLKNVHPPTKSLSLSGEATLESDETPVALVFGPENGAISERLVFEAAKEANARNYGHLIVFGFAIEPNARELVDRCEELVGISATYVQATPDLVMGDLLKTMRSSQVFSVTGLPDVAISSLPPEDEGGPPRYQVELRGLDVFDPTTMETDHRSGDDVPAWFLDTDYNDLSFHVSQAFFPRTSAWDSLKRALGAEYEESVWEHLAGSNSAPFVAGDNRKIAVKVIDDRGNELMVVRPLDG